MNMSLVNNSGDMKNKFITFKKFSDINDSRRKGINFSQCIKILCTIGGSSVLVTYLDDNVTCHTTISNIVEDVLNRKRYYICNPNMIQNWDGFAEG